MPRQQARSASRQKAILDAALACFDEYGYELTSIQQIRERSGASVGSIYHHFGDKDGIAAVLYLEGIASYQAAVLAALGTSTADSVRGVVAAHLQWCERNKELARFLDTKRDLEVTLASQAQLTEANRTFRDTLHEWMAPRVQVGELVDIPLELCVSLLIGPAQLFMRGRLGGSRAISTRRARTLLGEAAWAALRGPAAR